MAYRLMKEDGQEVAAPSKASTTPKKKEAAKNVTASVNDGISWVASDQFPGDQCPGSTRDNPVHLSDATDASAPSSRPRKDNNFDDKAKLSSHFSDALHEMAASIVGLEDGYFKALYEVITETERALRDVSHINAHYVSQVVMVMSSWQEVVQTAASHMDGVDTTTYLTCCEDARRVTREYVAAVVKAREERDAAHVVEEETQKKALKDDDYRDPVVRLLQVTWKAAHAQCEKAVDAFLSSIKTTLRKHVPVHAQGPLISNALSTAFQFQMSVWHMIGKECIHPVRAKHSDWCGLVGIIQAIVETFPKNCALMFPRALSPAIASFSNTFRPQSSDDNDDDEDNVNHDDAEEDGADSGFHRFDASLSVPPHGDLGGTGRIFTSTPLPHGGVFHLSTNPKEPPSSSLGAAPDDDEEHGSQPDDDNLDMGEEADDEEDGEKEPAGDETLPNQTKIELLQEIINPATYNQQPSAPKSGEKRGPSHLDSGSISSDSSVEDMDAKNTHPKKPKGSIPTKASTSGSHPSHWTEEDIDVVCQTRYEVDLKRFQTYRLNKIDPGDTASTNTKDQSAYIDVVRADPGSVIHKSVFSVAAYREVLKWKGGDISRFDKDVGAMFKKGPKGPRVPDTEKVAIDQVILVCQHEP